MHTRRFLLLATLSGFFAVILGAFGAHILRKTLGPDQLDLFETGVRYQFYNTFALFIVAIVGRWLAQRWVLMAGSLLVAGAFLFSGSLYLLALAGLLGLEDSKSFLGPITPIGGVLMLGGWLSLFRAAFDYKKMGSSGHKAKSSSNEK